MAVPERSVAPARRPFALRLLANIFPPLQGLRVLALVLVLQLHLTVVFLHAGLLRPTWLARLSLTTFFGTDLFFVMSGFLIGTLILHSVDGRGGGALRFYARRGFRTFPLYYVCLTALALLVPLSATRQHQLPYEYAFLTNYYPAGPDRPVMGWGWSLCVQEHFYLAVPVVMLALRRIRSHPRRLALLGVVWASAFVVRLAIFLTRATPWTAVDAFYQLHLRTHTRYDILVAGIFLAYVQHHFRPELERLFARRAVRWGALAVVAAGLYVLVQPDLFASELVYDIVAWGTLTSLVYIVLVPLVLDAPRAWPLTRALSAPIFLRVATLSYGMYLTHVPVAKYAVVPIAERIARAHPTLPGGVLWTGSLVVLFVLSAAGAYLLHLLVEKPALRLRDRLVP